MYLLQQGFFLGGGNQGTSYNNCLVNSDHILEKYLTEESTYSAFSNSNRLASFPDSVKVSSSYNSSLVGRERKHSCHCLFRRQSLTFGSSFFTMLSHTFLRRALSCSMDKCFFLIPGGGASWENLAKTLVWWWWRRGDSSEESSSSLRLFFFTFFNLAAKETDSQKIAFLPFHRRQPQNHLITLRKFKVLSSFHQRLAMFIPLSSQAHEYSKRKIFLP